MAITHLPFSYLLVAAVLMFTIIFGMQHGDVIAIEPGESQENGEVSRTDANEGEDPREDRGQDAQVPACEVRADSIMHIMDRNIQRGERFNELLDVFAEELAMVHERESLGVNDYQSRLDAIQERSETIDSYLDQLKELSKGFDCENPDPGNHVQDFIEVHRELISVLSNHRDAIVDLALDVRAEWGGGDEPEETDEESEEELPDEQSPDESPGDDR